MNLCIHSSKLQDSYQNLTSNISNINILCNQPLPPFICSLLSPPDSLLCTITALYPSPCAASTCKANVEVKVEAEYTGK